MGGVLIMILFLISSLVLNFCSSMQVNHPRLQGNETDRLALLAVKAQIQHHPNLVTSSWNETLHFCMWQGVTCGRRHRQRVTKLDFGSMELAGTISPHIGNLSFLRTLVLENNSFTHQIPPQIGHLRRLQVLFLNNNSLSGTIPLEISSCLQLTYLSLGMNNLVGQIPPQLGSLSKLQGINLQFLNLTGDIPPSLGNLSYLKLLALTENHLEGSIPSSLCQLKGSVRFCLGVNRLSSTIPSCIYNLSGIDIFEVSVNQIQGSLPSNVGNAFPSLKFFLMAKNQFTGAILLSISNATNLAWFLCQHNKLNGQVPNLQKLHNVKEFSVLDNNLGSGKEGDLSFVSELINATELRYLVCNDNNFGGTFPTSIFNLSSTTLQGVGFGGNYLHGRVPTGFGNLVNLQVLAMEGNNFIGSIPSDLGKISGLGEVSLKRATPTTHTYTYFDSSVRKMITPTVRS